jgi:hypothetical protein
MRKLILITGIIASAAGCVHSQDVPPVQPILPTAAPTSPAASPIVASPAALTLSVSALQPPFPSFSTLTVIQQGANQPPFVIQAQSTCLTNNNIVVFASSASGSTSTYQVKAITIGQCVMVFGGLGGAITSVPITVQQ